MGAYCCNTDADDTEMKSNKQRTIASERSNLYLKQYDYSQEFYFAVKNAVLHAENKNGKPVCNPDIFRSLLELQ